LTGSARLSSKLARPASLTQRPTVTT
jgi:hypothetical protein